MFADRLILGAGMLHFEKPQLERYRNAVGEDRTGQKLVSTIEKLRKAGPYEAGGESLKRVPRGYDPEHPRAALLKYEGLFAYVEGAIPPEATSHAFVDYCLSHFRELRIVNDWLNRSGVV
jgi:hypothetical protein